MDSDSTSTKYGSSNFGMAFLAIASGSSDVIVFLMLGHVFASAMTGNTALLGIAVSDGNWLAASQPVAALLGFVAGAALASTLYNPARSAVRQSTIVRTLLVFEAVCLGGFALVWEMSDHPTEGAVHYGLILLCSIGMGIQGIAAKRIDAPGVNTIVFTSTLVTITSSVTEILLGREDSPVIRTATKRQIAVFGAYGAGALIAGLLYWGEFPLLVWMPVTAIAIGLGSYEVKHTRPKSA